VVVPGRAVGVDAVEHQRRAAVARSVVDEGATTATRVIATHVGYARDAHARRQLAHVFVTARGWQRFKDVFLDIRRPRTRPHVDDQRLAGYRNVFFELPDCHLDVDGSHESRVDVDVGPGNFLKA